MNRQERRRTGKAERARLLDRGLLAAYCAAWSPGEGRRG